MLYTLSVFSQSSFFFSLSLSPSFFLSACGYDCRVSTLLRFPAIFLLTLFRMQGGSRMLLGDRARARKTATSTNKKPSFFFFWHLAFGYASHPLPYFLAAAVNPKRLIPSRLLLFFVLFFLYTFFAAITREATLKSQYVNTVGTSCIAVVLRAKRNGIFTALEVAWLCRCALPPFLASRASLSTLQKRTSVAFPRYTYRAPVRTDTSLNEEG